jgi:hypothetical protein
MSVAFMSKYDAAQWGRVATCTSTCDEMVAPRWRTRTRWAHPLQRNPLLVSQWLDSSRAGVYGVLRAYREHL